MTVLLVLFFFVLFLLIDWFKTAHDRKLGTLGTTITTPGFEALGALAQDGGGRLQDRGHIAGRPARTRRP